MTTVVTPMSSLQDRRGFSELFLRWSDEFPDEQEIPRVILLRLSINSAIQIQMLVAGATDRGSRGVSPGVPLGVPAGKYSLEDEANV